MRRALAVALPSLLAAAVGLAGSACGSSSTQTTPTCGAGNAGECYCRESVAGHAYDLSCSEMGCTCAEDGSTTATLSTYPCDAADVASVMNDAWTHTCRFPQ
jgi:hypothetical protein